MQRQRNWLENASIMASALPVSFDPTRILYCSRHGLLCEEPDFCYRCNLDLRVEPLQTRFADVFVRRPYWHAMVVDYEIDPERAGLWTGLRDDLQLLYAPHQGKPLGKYVRCCPHKFHFVKSLCDLFLGLVDKMKRIGAIDGYLAVIEPNLSFWPDPASPFHWWSGIDHALLPHVHFLVCGEHPLDPVMMAAYDHLQRDLDGWSYANIWFNPIRSQRALTGWINYCIKPWPLADWYLNASFAGCQRAPLNYTFDDVALETCRGAFAQIFSPRRAGVLSQNAGEACILDPLPRCLSRKELARCADEKFYHEHEASFWRTIEKREVRMSRTFRCRTQTHKAAVRRLTPR